MPIRTWLTLSAIWPLALASESSLSRSFSATTSKSSITSNVTWRGEGGGDINRLNASSNGSSSPFMPPNCTQLCRVWKGEECYEYRPCMFCNQSVSCDPDYLVCRENVCMLDEYEGSMRHTDPLGRVIALILVTIFFLSLFTLFLRVCYNICGGGGSHHQGSGVRTPTDRRLQPRCCQIHCAVSIHCCCDWKTGRLRIIPDEVVVGASGGVGNNNANSAVMPAINPGGDDSTPQRDSLYPVPPPAYLDIFPETQNSSSSTSAAATNAPVSSPTTAVAASSSISTVSTTIAAGAAEPSTTPSSVQQSGLPTTILQVGQNQDGEERSSSDNDHGSRRRRRESSGIQRNRMAQTASRVDTGMMPTTSESSSRNRSQNESSMIQQSRIGQTASWVETSSFHGMMMTTTSSRSSSRNRRRFLRVSRRNSRGSSSHGNRRRSMAATPEVWTTRHSRYLPSRSALVSRNNSAASASSSLALFVDDDANPIRPLTT